MVKPEHLAAWQVEQIKIQEETLGSDLKTSLESDEPPEPYVPEKWRLE